MNQAMQVSTYVALASSDSAGGGDMSLAQLVFAVAILFTVAGLFAAIVTWRTR
jgi:hypothetical protein